MRVSHKYRFVFVSKPKCATSSIRKMLNEYSDVRSKDENTIKFHHHSTALELKLAFKQEKWNWDDYYKFISIRNPWDMVVSYYHYSKSDINGYF